MYELIALRKPFELLSESPETLLRKQQRPEIPKVHDIVVFNMHAFDFVAGEFYSMPFSTYHESLLETKS